MVVEPAHLFDSLVHSSSIKLTARNLAEVKGKLVIEAYTKRESRDLSTSCSNNVISSRY